MMSSINQILPVSNITGVTELLSDLAGREQSAYRNLMLPESAGKNLHRKTQALASKKTATDTSDVMMMLENQAVMAKWHTEISFYSRMLHLTLNAADTVIKGQ
ncbi:hypothetical protein AB7W15_13820 [Morganella morganii]|uniref:hypothetical protein n=1 Tax=Morganella morganii TaxID=582 RepID=UPI001E520DA8|nr:hypothetical protein [Morganella morganii]MDM8752194.1 hypothetical protein [Morganella morganii]